MYKLFPRSILLTALCSSSNLTSLYAVQQVTQDESDEKYLQKEESPSPQKKLGTLESTPEACLNFVSESTSLIDCSKKIQVTANIFRDKKVLLDMKPDDTIERLKRRLYIATNVHPDALCVIGTSRFIAVDADESRIKDYMKSPTSLELLISPLVWGGGSYMYAANYIKEAMEEAEGDNLGYRLEPDYEIKSFHVSCQSDKPKKLNDTENLGGVVLYAYDGKGDWRLNGVHCKSGYIILKNIRILKEKGVTSGQGMIHGMVYKSVFGVEPDNRVVGGGFAYKDGKWKFNSWTFNAGGEYHDMENGMSRMEERMVMEAVKNWIEKGQQNTPCDSPYPIATCKKVVVETSHPGKEVWALDWSPDSKFLAYGCGDNGVRLDNLVNKELNTIKTHENPVRSVRFSYRGDLLASGSGNYKNSDNEATIHLWSTREGKPAGSLAGHTDLVWSLDFSPVQPYYLASGSNDTTVRLWDIEATKEIKKYRSHDTGIRTLRFAPASSIIASGSFGKISFSDIRTHEEVKVLFGGQSNIRSLCFINSNSLAAASHDGYIRFWDLRRNRERTEERLCISRPIKCPLPNPNINSIHCSADGRFLAAGTKDEFIHVWDMQINKAAILKGNFEREGVRSVCFAPDGNSLAAGNPDATVRLWNIKEIIQEIAEQQQYRIEKIEPEAAARKKMIAMKENQAIQEEKEPETALETKICLFM